MEEPRGHLVKVGNKQLDECVSCLGDRFGVKCQIQSISGTERSENFGKNLSGEKRRPKTELWSLSIGDVGRAGDSERRKQELGTGGNIGQEASEKEEGV